MTIDEMKKRKTEMGFTNEMIAELSGVPLGTVQKIFCGKTRSPRYDTLRALQKVLADDVLVLCEPSAAYNRVKAKPQDPADERDDVKTLADYLALPEGTRIELIDGKFYDMAAPTTIHQGFGGEIFTILKNHVAENGGECVPFIAPTDVQLDCDDKTMVQPDVLVVCDRKKITKARIVGAPDFIAEVSSPSNTGMDIFIKKNKYKKAGVNEYWIIFPESKEVMVYDFAKSAEPSYYTFNDTVPVAIWDGKCSVDFRSIYKRMEFMYEQ
ncbi:MAG: Uma2 family endonuclease [Lachnospiraceae bacterium]|nr:Uma2 family endonuclease [Lachnospiraceae bacterium]